MAQPAFGGPRQHDSVRKLYITVPMDLTHEQLQWLKVVVEIAPQEAQRVLRLYDSADEVCGVGAFNGTNVIATRPASPPGYVAHRWELRIADKVLNGLLVPPRYVGPGDVCEVQLEY